MLCFFFRHNFNKSLFKNIFLVSSHSRPSRLVRAPPNRHFPLHLLLSVCAHSYQLAPQLQPHLRRRLFPKFSTPNRHLRLSSLKKVFPFSIPVHASVLCWFTLVKRNLNAQSSPICRFPPYIKQNSSRHNENARSAICLYWGCYLKTWICGYYLQGIQNKLSRPEIH